jgi:hypothetical protein
MCLCLLPQVSNITPEANGKPPRKGRFLFLHVDLHHFWSECLREGLSSATGASHSQRWRRAVSVSEIGITFRQDPRDRKGKGDVDDFYDSISRDSIFWIDFTTGEAQTPTCLAISAIGTPTYRTSHCYLPWHWLRNSKVLCLKLPPPTTSRLSSQRGTTNLLPVISSSRFAKTVTILYL